MKLLSIATANGPRLAAKIPSGILVFSQAAELFPGKPLPHTLQAAILSEGGLGRLLPHLQAVLDHPEAARFVVPENAVEIVRPYLPPNVICVGLNYREHAREAGLALPKNPVLFAKWNTSVIGPGEAIVLPPETQEVDYEAELAVVIGQKCRGVSQAEALDYVAGYTCMNDVSARDFQRADSQWVRCKSQDTFGPLGPCLVTADEIADPQSLGIRCRLNGELMQNSSTADMIFNVRELISYLSRGITLHPGDLITTGTPQGVGFARKPPIFLKDGDRVVVEIDGIGSLSNPVKAN